MRHPGAVQADLYKNRLQRSEFPGFRFACQGTVGQNAETQSLRPDPPGKRPE